MSRTKVALVATLLASSSAWANGKYTRDQAVKIDVTLSDRVRPIQPRSDSTGTKPEVDADQALRHELDVSKIRDDQEAILVQLIAQTPDSDSDEKADYYFRLGDLYAKQQRVYRLETVEAQIAVDKAKTPEQKAKAQNAANAAAQSAMRYLAKAVTAYKALNDNDAFRNYPHMDKALFYLGYTLQRADRVKEARAVYDKLLKNYPSSKFVPEAHLAFADYYFENGQLDDAEAHYKQALWSPTASVHWYAMYKMGWIDLNKQRFQQALETFFQVASSTKMDKNQEMLNHAAKKDFVRAYAEVGKPDKAFEAFRRVDSGYAFEMLQILADLYLDQGKSDKAIYTYRDLMTRAPTHKNVCLWQYNVAHASLAMPGWTNADKVAEIERLVKLWGALRAANVLPAAEAKDCHDNAAAMSGELARAYHAESAKSDGEDIVVYADKLYSVYLATFPDAEDFAQTQYYDAELQWSRADREKSRRLATERWEKAAVAFTDVVKTGKVDPKLMKESALAAVLAWKNALDLDPRPDADLEPNKGLQPLPIPAREQKMLAAFDIYIHYIKDPNDPELVGMKFLKAKIYRDYNHFDEALPIFQDILDHHPDHETAEYSANLLLDTYNRLGRFDEMLALVAELEGNTKFLDGKSELKARLERLERQSIRNKAQALCDQAKDTKDFAKYVECGEAYVDIYNRNPQAADNDEILYNAGVCFEEGKSIGLAIQMYNSLKRYYPKSPITQRAIARLGKAYGDIASYDRAADELEQFAKRYPGEKEAFNALNDAVLFRRGIGDDDRAIADTKFFIDQFGRKHPGEAANAAYSLVTIYEKRGDNGAVIEQLENYIRVWGSKGGDDKLVIAHAKIATLLWHESCPVKETDGSCVKVTRERATVMTELKQQRKTKATYVAPLQCEGGESKIKLTLVKRDDRKVREALSESKQAAAIFATMKSGASDPGWASARHWVAKTKLVEADVELERYLAIKLPTDLDFGDGAPEHKAIEAKAQKRFNAWLAIKTKAAGVTAKRYDDVLAIRDNASSIEAAARRGQITQNLSDELFTAPIPAQVRKSQIIDGYDVAQDKVDAYCGKVTEVAGPLADQALANYGLCLDESTKLGWFSEWSRLCERELGQIRPGQYPTTSELRGDSNRVAPVIALEPMARLQ
jgi:tetratricopeptide (TPR) repeat protein